MVDCKLGALETRFTPQMITLFIEVIPIEGQSFDMPIEDATNKLNAVANYARTTFGVRVTPISTQEPSPQGKILASTREEKKQASMAKTLKGGADRAIQVLEGELARANKEKNPEAIAKAEMQLTRAKAMKAKTSGKA